MADRIRIVVDADANGAVRGLQRVQGELRQTGQTAQRSAVTSVRSADQSTAAMGRQTRQMGMLGSAARVTAGLLGTYGVTRAVGAAVRSFATFEQGMNEVRAVTGANAREMAALSAAARKLGEDTGMGAGKATVAIAELAKGGLDASTIIEGGLAGAIALAQAGSMELGDAAAGVANALNLFGLEGKDATMVADALANAANATTADVSDFAMALSQGGGAAKAAGLSFTETVVALEALAKAGVKNSDAGTSLKTTLAQIVKPTKEAKEAMVQYGLSFFDAEGNMRALPQVADQLREKTGALTREQRLGLFQTIAGTDGFRTLLALYDAGPEKLRRYQREVTKQGTAEKVAAEKTKGFYGELGKLGAQLEDVAISAGTKTLPHVTRFLKEMRTGTGAGGRFADQMQEVGREVRDIAVPIGEAALAVGKFGRDHPDLAKAAASFAVIGGAAGKIGKLTGAGSLLKLGFGRGNTPMTPMFVKDVAFGAGKGAVPVPGGKTPGRVPIPSPPQIAAAVAAVLTGREIVHGGRKEKDYGLPTQSGTAKFVSRNAPALGGLFGALDSHDKLKRFGAEIDGLKGKLDKLSPAKLRELRTEAEKLARTEPSHRSGLNRLIDDLNTNLGTKLPAALRVVDGAWEAQSKNARKNLGSIRAQTDVNMQSIRRRLDVDSRAGKEALARNFSGAANAVREAMAAGVVSTAAGTAEIDRLMRKALAQFGIKGKAADRYLNNQDTLTGKTIGGSGDVKGAAKGGFWLGREGAAGRDTIPMRVNGQNVIAAEGEYVGIFNRHQKKDLDRRTADEGGLGGFLASKPKHYMAGGGVVDGGGNIVSLGKRLQRQGYHVSEHPAFGGVKPGAHAPGGYHYKGGALDINADGRPGGEAKWLDRLNAQLQAQGWNTIWRAPGHFDHLHVDVSGGGGTGGVVENLKRVLWDGPGGALGALGQRGLDAVREAAQASLESAMGPVTETGGAGSGGSGGFDKAALAALWRQAGGDAGSAGLMAQIALAESRGNPRALGIPVPRQGQARGLWQIMWPLHAGRFKGMDPYDPLDNARMAVDIKRDQGLRAWEAYTNGAYAQFAAGGMLDGPTASAAGKPGKRKPRKVPPRKKRRSVLGNTLRRAGKTKHPWPGGLFDRIDRIESEIVPDQETLLELMRRRHDRTDEDALIGALDEQDSKGNYKIPQADADRQFAELVRQRVGELGQQFRRQDEIAAWYDDPKQGLVALSQMAVERIDAAIAERKEQEARLVRDAIDNKRQIVAAQQQLDAIPVNLKNGDTRAKKKARLERRRELGVKLDGLRDRRERLIGTRSVAGSLDGVQGEDDGQLGKTRVAMGTFRSTRPDYLRKIRTSELEGRARRLDVQDTGDEITAWGARRPEERATVDAPDNGLADVYKQQRDEARRDFALSESQASVFRGFAPLVEGRLVGSFARGAVRVPETGMARIHKDEMILPDPDGPFGQRMGAAPAAPHVEVIVSGDIGPLVQRIDARIDGKVAKVSQQMGRRQALITSAPGGR